MRSPSRLWRPFVALLATTLSAALLTVLPITPANAELQHPRQDFLRQATGGLFLHWGMRTSPGYTSCSAWENAVTSGGWDPAYWVREAQKLHTQYLVLATFHSRLGYARPWPSAIPGSCHTKRDILKETIDAATAKGLKVILYMTDDPQWHADGLPAGKSWLDSAAYSQYKGKSVDLTTRDGFGQFSYDNFVEVMQRYPSLGGFWIDNDNAYWESHGLYDKIRHDRPNFTLSNNNEDTPIMDMISNEQKTGMSPAYDYPQAIYTAAPRLIEADFKLPSTGSWWYGGGDPAVDTKLTLGRLISNTGSSVKSLMAETAMVDGRFPAKQEQFNNLVDKYLDPIWPSITGTTGGGYDRGGLQPGSWNDGAQGVTTVSATNPDLHYVHVLTKPSGSTLKIRDNGYRIAKVTNLRTGATIAHTQAAGTLTMTGLTAWDPYDTVLRVESAGREGIIPATSYQTTSSAGSNPAYATDGSYLTYWDSNKTTPVSLRFDLGSSKRIQYLGINQREDSVSYARSSTEQSARIRDYKVYVSSDGTNWGTAIKTGTLPSRRGVAFIDLPVKTARHVRLEVLNTYAASSDTTRYKRLRIDEAWVGTAYATPAVALKAATFNVKDYGAKGNGTTNDTAAINKAITAANAAGGGTVRFTEGTYRSANSIHLKSNVTIQLDAGSTILGSPNKTYDAAEANPNDNYQDYGHSHFHDAMLWGDRLTNVAFTGSGTIDGDDHLITGNPKAGEADKIISLTRCNGLRLDGIRLRQGGHFAILTNGCDNVTSNNLRIETAGDRDGWNVINAKNVTVTNANIAANDDALVFKSDWALGETIDNGHVRVSDSKLSAGCCNALMFGSETCGDFTDYVFERITITGAGKSGLGLVSMDGSKISDVHYRDITMSGTRSHIMQKVGTRRRCGDSPGVGGISDITYQNITGTYDGAAGTAYSSTLWGESAAANRIRNVSFDNVKLTVPGGNATMSTAVPSNDPTNYNPNSIGTRPAYGWYLRRVNGVKFTNSSVRFSKNDGRPAVIANDSTNVKLDGFTAQRGNNSPHDLGFQTVTGYCATGQNTTGGTLRISATGSTKDCAAARLMLDNGLAKTPPMGFNNWNSTKCRAEFNEAMIKGIADLFVSKGLKAAGYQYVNIDDCWALPQRNTQGNLVPDPARFPNGIKALADYVHGKGLKFGLYTSAGTKTCDKAGFPGGLGHEKQDASLFASWGVDYLKYDNCNNQNVDAQQRYTAMRDALRDTGRPITYSICEWGRTGPPRVWEWAGDVGNLWRTTGDISDNWASMIGKAQANRVLAQYAGPGHWNDPDMLEVGNGGMTATEYKTHLSLWAMMSAPLLIGTDLRKASDETYSILTNPDVIAVDQDRLGRQATVVSSTGGLVVYGRTLANGDRAVALSNETASAATVSTTAAALGLGGSSSYELKDLWSKATRSTSGSISASVPAHGTVIYRVSRAGTTTRYEAELANSTPGSTVDKDHSGYSGTGFVNTPNAVGSYVEWAVSQAQAGAATLAFDHANGTATDRPMDISVNGVVVKKNVSFPNTGAWTLWRDNVTTVNLAAGQNVIRATATNTGGTPNLDYLEVAR